MKVASQPAPKIPEYKVRVTVEMLVTGGSPGMVTSFAESRVLAMLHDSPAHDQGRPLPSMRSGRITAISATAVSA